MPIKFQSRAITKWIITGFLSMGVTGAWGGNIQMRLEEPDPNEVSVYSGVANIRGWVVGSRDIDRVELYIDGRYTDNIPIGGNRPDVHNNFPTYPNSANSGFSMAFNYSTMSAGSHSILVKAIDADGISQQSSASFQVVRFDNSYTNNVSLNEAVVSGEDSKTVVIKGMIVDGKSYDARLDWRTEIQGYAFSSITPVDNNGNSGPIWFPDFSSPSSGVSGGKININLVTQNIGRQSTVEFEAKFYLSKSLSITNNDFTGYSCTIPPLQPNAYHQCAGPIGVPQVAAGKYYLIVYSDVYKTGVANSITITSGGECITGCPSSARLR